MFKDGVEAERAARDQDADWARIDAAIDLAGQDTAALQTRQIDPDETRKEWFAIRDRTILAVRDCGATSCWQDSLLPTLQNWVSDLPEFAIWRRRQTQELRICLPIMVRPND
jgi:hypothetical protein